MYSSEIQSAIILQSVIYFQTFEACFKQSHQVSKKEQVHGCIYITSEKFCHATKAVTWKIITEDSCAKKPEEIQGGQGIS